MSTIKEVAAEAGVSKSTVSRYISQKGYVSDQARDRIKEAIDKLNYSPNMIAQSLKTKKNQLVGLLLPDISNPFFPRVARGAEIFLKEHDYRILFGNIGGSAKIEEDYINTLLQSNAAGIITTHDFTKKYPNLAIPVVVVDRVEEDTEYAVFADNEEGGKLAAQAVSDAGAKNVLLIRGPLGHSNIANQRYVASLNYLSHQNVMVHISESHTFDFDDIIEEARINLTNYPTVDSIIAPSDIHAIAYIHELFSKGKKIPEDVQVVGYDDILMSKLIYPSLSTIHQPSYRMGRYAAELIYKISNHIPIEEKRIKLPVHFVERETLRR
ncbi:LacI family DNA-binding transcriptional regulator [Streptococcus hongkongensis]|nr:LacI family transcriptional regulator [Streptococcus uberis]